MAVWAALPLALACLFEASDAQLTPAGGKKPHIGAHVRKLCCRSTATHRMHIPRPVFHLVDDWGWANSGWHANPQNEKEVHTPRMDALVKEGIELCVRSCQPPFVYACLGHFASGLLV